MKQTGVDIPKLKKWAKCLKPRDFDWLRGTVTFALSTPYDLREFVMVATSRDPNINDDPVHEMVEQLTEDELIYFCDEFKRPPQHEKRRGSDGVRYRQILQNTRPETRPASEAANRNRVLRTRLGV